MRSYEEIVEKVRKDQLEAVLSFAAEVLVPYLPFEYAKEFLKPEVTVETWKNTEYTRENVLADMRGYMEFAWGKVRDHRGLSAGRSVDKMALWVWLLGDDLAEMKALPYKNYGAPRLKWVCEQYGFPIPDDAAVRRMAESKQCMDECEEGCAK